jgi:hypothetical protein
MSDNVTLFPNILQPATALKACPPIGVKFWENQETALEGLKEFADGWFAQRHESEDGKAYQQQVLRAGSYLSASPEARPSDERRTG